MAPLMEHVPPARLFDEMLKLLLSGHASACLRQLREVGLHKGLLPLLDVILEQPLGERFVTLALAQTDERVLADRPVSPGVPVRRAALARGARGLEGARRRAASADPGARDRRWTRCSTRSAPSSPSRAGSTATMREVWAMQPRFENRSGNRAYRLLEAPRFRMAYDFLALRAASGEVPGRARGLVARLPERRRRHAQGHAAARDRAAASAGAGRRKKRRRGGGARRPPEAA